VTSVPAVLSVPGETYVLAGDFTLPGPGGIALQITADNIKLDGNGHTLKGPGALTPPKSIGIEVVGTNGVRIEHVAVTGFTHGVRIRSNGAIKAQHATLSGVQATGNDVGIQLAYADYCRVTGCNCSANMYYGIYLASANNNLCSRNLVADNTSAYYTNLLGHTGGIYVGSSDGNRLSDNAILRNGAVGVWLYLDADSNTVEYNTISSTGYTGIASNGSQNSIRENLVFWNRDGIVLAQTGGGNTVEKNRVFSSSHLDMTDESLSNGSNTWTGNSFASDNESGPAFGPGAGVIQ
jgi:parallel beta-helix repeat protein